MVLRGSKILTHYGYKTIEDITFDDSLLNISGLFENQQKSHIRKQSTIFQFKTYMHPFPFSAVPEQMFYVREKHRTWNLKTKCFDYSFGKPLWKCAKEITYRDYIGMSINALQNDIPEFDAFDWYLIGKNYSHYSVLQEWLHNASTGYIQLFLQGFDNTEPMTYNLALGIQRLNLKARIISKIVCNSNNQFRVVEEKYGSFIENGFAWYRLQNIKKKHSQLVDVYEITDTFIMDNIISISTNDHYYCR